MSILREKKKEDSSFPALGRKKKGLASSPGGEGEVPIHAERERRRGKKNIVD